MVVDAPAILPLSPAPAVADGADLGLSLSCPINERADGSMVGAKTWAPGRASRREHGWSKDRSSAPWSCKQAGGEPEQRPGPCTTLVAQAGGSRLEQGP